MQVKIMEVQYMGTSLTRLARLLRITSFTLAVLYCSSSPLLQIQEGCRGDQGNQRETVRGVTVQRKVGRIQAPLVTEYLTRCSKARAPTRLYWHSRCSAKH